MKFTKFIATAALSVSLAMAALTSPQIVASIKTVTVQSQNLQVTANSIQPGDAVLFLAGLGPFPIIITGFTDITKTVQSAVVNFSGTKPFSLQSDQQAILDAWVAFVKVHQQLLNILIGKAGILNNIPIVGPPVSAALRGVEGVVDTIALGLVGVCPATASGLTSGKVALDGTIQITIKTYGG